MTGDEDWPQIPALDAVGRPDGETGFDDVLATDDGPTREEDATWPVAAPGDAGQPVAVGTPEPYPEGDATTPAVVEPPDVGGRRGRYGPTADYS